MPQKCTRFTITRMKMEEQELTDLVSRYLDNALPAEETSRLMEAVRSDPAAADLLCELALQHVQLRKLFRQEEAVAPRREVQIIAAARSAARSWRVLALAACLAVIAAAGFWLAGFSREHFAEPLTISLLKIGSDITVPSDSKTAPDGTMVLVPPGTIQLLSFRDGTIIQLEPGSVARIVDDGLENAGYSCKTINLTSGMLLADVARQPDDFPLKVTTPHAEIIVAGTRLTCKVEKDHTHVRMHEGWAHVVNAINGVKTNLMSRHHITAGERFHFRLRSVHEDAH